MGGLARPVFAALVQNLGTGAMGAYLDLTGKLTADGLGPITHMADNDLTKLSPGDVTLKIADHDDTVWAWVRANIQTPGQLLPCFLVVWVGNARAFFGTVKPSNVNRDEGKHEIDLTSQDWSVLLANNFLDDWKRPLPRAISNRPEVLDKHGYSPEQIYTPDRDPRDPRAVWSPNCVVTFPTPNNWLAVGDQLKGSLTGEALYKVVAINNTTVETSSGFLRPIPTPNFTATLDGLPWTKDYTAWDSYGCEQADFTRLSSNSTERDYFLVNVAYNLASNIESHALCLDTIDGIVPGDTLRIALGQGDTQWTVLQVDPDLNQVITREPMVDLVVGDRIQFSTASLAELVYVDARAALQRASAPYPVDLTRYAQTALPTPALVWLPLRPGITATADLMAVRDVDAGLTDLRVLGSGSAAWDGTPEAGWAPSGVPGSRAVWTSQLLAAPASLMPFETPALVPTAPRRNRAYDPRWRDWVDLSQPAPWNLPWDTVAALLPAGLVLYDYLLMRRVRILGHEVYFTPWTGTAWGADTYKPWPGLVAPLSACVMPGVADAVLALLPGGLQLAMLSSDAASYVLPIPAVAADAVLVTTPWGAYLVGSMGYGRVEYFVGTLTLAWVTLGDSLTCLFPSTFCAMGPDEVFVLSRLDNLDRQGKKSTETWALRLLATPTTAGVSKIWNEKIMEGTPITLGAIRDPNGTRIIGHAGGRLFQVASFLPTCYALERFTPSGMTSADLIEHICQIIQAVAYPDATGTLHIVSRALVEAPINLTVDQVSIVETRAWSDFFSVVRVSGQGGDDVYSDASGPVAGGGLLEISSHPLLWTVSGCEAVAQAAAAWFGLPRRVQVQKWFCADAGAAPPWEGLPPLAQITINGAPQAWICQGSTDDKVKGEATATLLEVV